MRLYIYKSSETDPLSSRPIFNLIIGRCMWVSCFLFWYTSIHHLIKKYYILYQKPERSENYIEKKRKSNVFSGGRTNKQKLMPRHRPIRIQRLGSGPPFRRDLLQLRDNCRTNKRKLVPRHVDASSPSDAHPTAGIGAFFWMWDFISTAREL